MATYGHTTAKSQKTQWAHLRKFAKYLRAAGCNELSSLPSGVLIDYRNWLAMEKLALSSADCAFRTARAMLSYCERSASHVLNGEMKLSILGFGSGETRHRESIPDQEVKKILSCCYGEIERIEQRLKFGRILVSGGAPDNENSEKSKLISELLDLGKGVLPTQVEIFRARRNLKRRVLAHGGLRVLAGLLWLCTDDLLPFYLALLIQTSGNASSMKEIERDCIRSHPVRSDLERIVWKKRRANREQWVDMPVGRKWSAANIVRRLRVLNEDLIPRCPVYDRDKLFLAYRLDKCLPGFPSDSRLVVLKNEFADRHGLPNFTFSSIRRAGARAHHKATGDTRVAQKRLNHTSLRTTARYLDANELAETHDRIIRGYQGMLLRASIGLTETSSGSGSAVVEMPAPAETVFGFGCVNPFAGLAEGSKPGVLCMQFQKCAVCPGAIIPLDDVTVVARLLAASCALEDARERALKEGWMPRFLKLYEPTREILSGEILPAVTETVRRLATEKMDKSRIPRLE
ncbi:hypothetical protein BCO18430_06489 [Burkholderia contaminans]|nr:hypothetical protein BCO18430_06489 [Burkholderia contaminans]